MAYHNMQHTQAYIVSSCVFYETWRKMCEWGKNQDFFWSPLFSKSRNTPTVEGCRISHKPPLGNLIWHLLGLPPLLTAVFPLSHFISLHPDLPTVFSSQLDTYVINYRDSPYLFHLLPNCCSTSGQAHTLNQALAWLMGKCWTGWKEEDQDGLLCLNAQKLRQEAYFITQSTKTWRWHWSYIIIYNEEGWNKIYEVCEPEEIPFNILKKESSFTATIKLVLFLCLRMHHAFKLECGTGAPPFGGHYTLYVYINVGHN